MKRKHVLFSVMLISLLTGCFQFRPVTPPPAAFDLEKEFQMGGYVPKIDNFIIILDSSSSMSVAYEAKADGEFSKFRVAKDIIKQMIYTMPEMNINGALQTFGHASSKLSRQTETVYGLTTYSRSGLEQSLNSVKSPAEGNSPAGLAIKATSDILTTASGDIAVILISDGEYLENQPLRKIRELQSRYRGRICLYTIWVGNKPEGKMFMEKLAGDTGCGFSTSVDKIAHSEDMTNFVIRVFLTTDKDSDNDGVPDSLDRCPDTPIGVEVDEFGCPKVSRIDSDGDGVYDDSDECPDTPIGATVDSRGCWIVTGIKFEYKKWNIQPQFNSNLDNIVKILNENQGLKIRIEGHTDNIGSKKYNLKLSRKRARSIKDYLVNKGIDRPRITTDGLGYSQPIASNDTSEGRALNRRAEIIPVK